MPFLTETELYARATRVIQRVHKSAGRILAEERAATEDSFDIFLSHSSSEPEEILLGIKDWLEETGLKVYVDKYSDPQLSPENVTKQTAAILRRRMRQSQALLYVHSRHSKKSRWMPWELGFFDGFKGRVGVVPVTVNQEDLFKGEEYLNLYPYIDRAPAKISRIETFWINQAPDEWASLYEWAKGTDQIHKRG